MTYVSMSTLGPVPPGSSVLKDVPLLMPPHRRAPWRLRGPSQISLTALASCGVRQVAGSLGLPVHKSALASNVQRRGSLMMPSFTPSFMSHAAIAALFAAALFAGDSPVGPTTCVATARGQGSAMMKRFQLNARAPTRKPYNRLPTL